MLRNYLKIALRNLYKQKTNTFINLLGLTLGITACMAIYVITDFELRYDRFHPDRERIFRVVGQCKFGNEAEFKPIGFGPRAMPAAIRQEVPGLETVATFHNMTMDVTIPDGSATPKKWEGRGPGSMEGQVVIADPQYFDIFRYKWLAGNATTALADANTVVLTEKKARRYFGDIPIQEMLGKTVVYRGKINATVTGIVEDWEQNSDFKFTDFIAAATIAASDLQREINLKEWNDVWSASQAFVKLSPGTTAAQVEKQLVAFGERHFGPDKGSGVVLFVPGLQPLSDLHFNEDYMDNYSRKAHLPTLYGLMGIAAFILLIAAINFINMATAQSVQRARATGIRKVLGSSRQYLIIQMIGETFITALLAAGLSVVLTPLILQALDGFIPDGVAFSLFSPDLILFLTGITLVTTLLSGLYPAWVLSAFQPAVALKGPSALAGNQKGYLRKGLIVFQFTFSLIFIIGTIIIGRQMQFIRDKDLGFNSDAVVLVNTEHDDRSKVLADKIRQIPGVQEVTMQWFAPMGENYMLTPVKHRNGGVETQMDVSAKVGDDRFIPMYELQVVAGRNYLPSDSLRELVINQAYAQALGFKTPEESIGALLNFDGRDYPVVGVVADFHEQSLHETIKPVFIGHIPGLSKDLGVKLSIRGGQISDVAQTLALMEKQWVALFPGKKFDYTFLDESIAKVYERDRRAGQLVNAATAIAIFISCLGLFGLVTFTTEQRTKEIGVRKVLGASVASLLALLTKDFVQLVLIALVIATPIAWWAMQQWLNDFAYRIDIQWWMFALAGLGALVIAFLTVGFQSIKAALVNPVTAIRSE